jgi:uncharacterized protein YodC (DUF2158 family)
MGEVSVCVAGASSVLLRLSFSTAGAIVEKLMTVPSVGAPARDVVTRSPKRNVGMVNCGWFQSQPIEHESRQEKHFVLRAILSPSVKRIQHQPFKLELDRRRSYTPDFLLVFENGEQAVFEVKIAKRVKGGKERLDNIAELLMRDELLYFVVHEGQIEGKGRLERAALIRRYAKLGMPDELVSSVTTLVQRHPRGIAIATVLKRCSISRQQLFHLIALRKVCTGRMLAIDDTDLVFPPRQEMHDAARQFGDWFGCAPWRTNARISKPDP